MNEYHGIMCWIFLSGESPPRAQLQLKQCSSVILLIECKSKEKRTTKIESYKTEFEGLGERIHGFGKSLKQIFNKKGMKIKYKNFDIEVEQYCYTLYFHHHYIEEGGRRKDGTYRNFNDVLTRMAHIGLYMKEDDEMDLANYMKRWENEMATLREEVKIPKIPVNLD